MKKTLIKYYFNPDRVLNGKEITHIEDGPMHEVADDLLRLIHSFSDEEFNSFFLNRGKLKLNKSFPALEEYGLIRKPDKDKDYYESLVMCHKNLVPVTGEIDWFIFTDWPDIAPDTPFYTDERDIQFNVGRDMVFPIHYEAVYLCNSLKGELAPNGKNVLDIFCGSGIFGVYALLNKAQGVRFIDNNVRALAFTLLNLAINRNNYRKNYWVSVLYSDIFVSLNSDDSSNKFDLILANPPFEPVPEGMKFYFSHSYGGEDGQFFLKLFLQNCLSYLKESGFVIGVDFSPGRVRKDDFTLNEILNSFRTNNSDWEAKPEVLDNCNLYEFASRYLALGIDIEDYHKWLFNLSKHQYVMLYFCWFIIGKNLSTIQIPEEKIRTNWANPLNWHYPCGITDKNKLPWVYLEDSFFIRENIYAQQLKNECLLSNHGMPEYFPITKMINDVNFFEILSSFTKSLQDFQYGILGKPQTVSWMSFPEYQSPDEENSGVIFRPDEAGEKINHKLKSRNELRQFIASELQNACPKIIIFYDIYNKNPEECNTYFGEFASCTMSLFISEGNNIVHEINLGKVENENLLPFVQEKLSKISFSIYKQSEDQGTLSLQTFCFILNWNADASILFSNLLKLNLNNKIIFDGLNKRLLFIISQGLNSLAMVGLIKERFDADRSKEERDRLQIVLKNINDLADGIRITASIYKDDIRMQKAKERFAKLLFVDKHLWDKPVIHVLGDDLNRFLSAQPYPLPQLLFDSDLQAYNLSWTRDPDSLKHHLLFGNVNDKDFVFRCISKLPSIINEIISQIGDSKSLLSHLEEFKGYLTFEDNRTWSPIFGFADNKPYWENYIKKMTKVVDIALSLSPSGPLFMPYFVYVLSVVWRGDVERPHACDIKITSKLDKQVSMVAKWKLTSAMRREPNSISNLLTIQDDEVNHVKGRLRFLSQIFPVVEGDGFNVLDDHMVLNINIGETTIG